MVTLLVGSTKAPFHVHMDLICQESPLFKAAFMGAGQFEETLEKSMHLHEEDPETVDRMIQWMYFKQYPIKHELVAESFDESEIASMQLITLYATADKFEVIELKNDVINRLYNLVSHKYFVFHDDSIEYVYKNTPPKSQLRRLIVEWHFWEQGEIKQKEANWYIRKCPDFATDLLVGLSAKRQGRKNPFKQPGGNLRFHETTKGDEIVDVSDSDSSSSDESSGGEDLPSAT